jgi:hypothetical protein
MAGAADQALWLFRLSIKARMSSALQTVVRGPSLMGLGKRPSLHPSHHVLLLMGKMERICRMRRYPVEGIVPGVSVGLGVDMKNLLNGFEGIQKVVTSVFG